jgi:hypothetical protein
MVFMVEAAERCLLACMKVSAALLLQIRGETKLKMVGPLVASWREQKKLQIITKTSPRRTIEVGDLSELEADDLLKNNVVTF